MVAIMSQWKPVAQALDRRQPLHTFINFDFVQTTGAELLCLQKGRGGSNSVGEIRKGKKLHPIK